MDYELEIHANMEKWRKEMAEIIEVAFLNSNNIDEFVREADKLIRKKFSMPYSLSLETLYYSLRTIWSLGGAAVEQGVQPTLLESGKIKAKCPNCEISFYVALPASQSG